MLKDNQKIYQILLIVSVVMFSFSLITKFYLCGSMNIQNGKLREIFSQKSELEKEISKLSYLDSTMSSLSYVEDRARVLGFVEMNTRLLSLDPKAPIQVAAIQVQ